MEQILNFFINTDSNILKGVFVMIMGLLFVFAVQVVFYFIIRVWTGRKKTSE